MTDGFTAMITTTVAGWKWCFGLLSVYWFLYRVRISRLSRIALVIVCWIGSASFYTLHLINAQDKFSSVDRAQEEHMKAIDDRANAFQADRDQRRLETLKVRDAQDARIEGIYAKLEAEKDSISDIREKVGALTNIGGTVMAVLTVLNFFGFFKLKSVPPAPVIIYRGHRSKRQRAADEADDKDDEDEED